jgi:signal transduction histidine kinase
MGVATLRTLTERRIAKSDTAAAARLIAYYPFLSGFVTVFWAIAPFLAWTSGHVLGPVVACAMLSAGYVMVITQFRASAWKAALASAPYSGLTLYIVLREADGVLLAATLSLIPIIGTAIAFGFVFNQVHARQLEQARQERERFLEDIAAAREAELQAERARGEAEAASSAKSSFLATMSHELRTPLNAIIGYGEILKENAVEDARPNDIADAERVISAANRLLTLINDVLDFSKVESGRMLIESYPFDVAQIVRDAADAVRPTASGKGIALSTQIGPLQAAHTDGFKLGQCLLNLLSNAVKFTKKGAVTLRAWSEAKDGREWLHFTVTDTGIGMTPDQLEKLFQPFVQADASHTRAFGGTGLGLVLTRRIANLMGGDVAVASRLGKGSTFTLSVPARFEAAHVDQANAA